MCKDNCGSSLELMKLSLLAYLEKAHKEGAALFVDGEELAPEEIVRRCVCEDSVYMPDYVLGEKGTLEQLRFDRIDPE